MGKLYQVAYGYSRDTGEYTGEVKAWESPLEPGVFHLPAHATFTAPPALSEGQVRIFDTVAEEWSYLPIPEPPEVVPPTTEELAAEARIQRNGLLQQTDWTQLPDVPISAALRAEYVAYRQSLRDVPAQSEFPNIINWPVVPVYQKS